MRACRVLQVPMQGAFFFSVILCGAPLAGEAPTPLFMPQPRPTSPPHPSAAHPPTKGRMTVVPTRLSSSISATNTDVVAAGKGGALHPSIKLMCYIDTISVHNDSSKLSASAFERIHGVFTPSTAQRRSVSMECREKLWVSKAFHHAVALAAQMGGRTR